MKRLAFALCLLLVPALGGHAQTCHKYQPDTVVLTGKMIRKTFPGPPNYESVKAGDRAETYWVLYLEKPICVEPATDSPSYEGPSEYNISKLQLIQIDYNRYRKLLGKRVSIKGKLTHAITGHHHTPVMLEVISIGPAT